MLSQDFLDSMHQVTAQNIHQHKLYNHLSENTQQDTQQSFNQQAQVTVDVQEVYNFHFL